MPRHETFPTREIPIATAIMAETKRIPNVVHNAGEDLVVFEFKHDNQIDGILRALAMGTQSVNASEYEKARSYLYRKAREAKR